MDSLPDSIGASGDRLLAAARSKFVVDAFAGSHPPSHMCSHPTEQLGDFE